MRPPGSLSESTFLASCIKCGQCLQVCPVQAIKLADAGDGFGVGTPYIDPRAQACDFSCDVLQCVLACPTGALTHEITYPHQATSGLARLARPEGCLAMQGRGFNGIAGSSFHKGKLRYADVDRWAPISLTEYPYDLELCDLCVRQCPIEIRIAECEAGAPPSGAEGQCPPQSAIRLTKIGEEGGVARFKPEVLAGCVGCGVCEMVCPAEPVAIVVDPREVRTVRA